MNKREENEWTNNEAFLYHKAIYVASSCCKVNDVDNKTLEESLHLLHKLHDKHIAYFFCSSFS
jgi:hypothetical protein